MDPVLRPLVRDIVIAVVLALVCAAAWLFSSRNLRDWVYLVIAVVFLVSRV